MNSMPESAHYPRPVLDAVTDWNIVFYVPSDYTEAGFAIQFLLKFTWEWKLWAN
jgi:hypothetical protein